jgi:V8-like Glu-specific endopeptidase
MFVAAASLAVAGGAQAVIGGTSDGTHTYVGAALETDSSGTALCTGSLVSPTVFVTAAHCFADGSTARVTFAPDYTSPAAQFSTGTVHDSGTADVAVIVFPGAVANSGLAQLPTAEYDDTLSAGQAVDVVGYGVQAFDQGTSVPPPGTRDVATTQLESAVSATDQSLVLGADPGACFGDSGGPNLVSGTNLLVAITSAGNADCTGVSSALRVDTPVVRAFLGQYVSLP